MHGVCEKCTAELSADYWTCGGFCSGTTGRFCFKCTGMSPEVQNAVNSNHLLHWMCNACTSIMTKARFTKAITSVAAAYEGIIETLKTEIRDNILLEIRSEIQTNLKQIPEIVANTPLRSVTARTQLIRNSAKRPRPTTNDRIDGIVGPPRKLLCGTDGQGTESPSITAEADHSSGEANLFWLYLSGISPKAPDDKVSDMIKARLSTEDVKITKLVPRGRDTANLTFVSFKVGMKPDLKQKAMLSSTWPMGVRFREFENYSSSRMGFWDPAADQTLPETSPMEQAN